jgi:hypothetical protein
MESSIIKKRLNTFRNANGRLRRVSNEVVMEVLRGWESWPGNSAEFYREIGLKKHQLAILIKQGKKLVKSGKVTESEFKEISFPVGGVTGSGFEGSGMELKLDANRAIRFGQVDQLVEFLKKTAP